MMSEKRIIIAGGGTGGHIFPAIAIAEALLNEEPSTKILFVGAKGKMEMEKIPAAGFEIVGLDIAGFDRSSLIKNIGLPFKLMKSFWQVKNIFKTFQPHAVMGVGGYSSFPVLRYAQTKAIPTFLHESNSVAGKSNILLGKRVQSVFVGTPGMEKYFPKNKINFSGNPVRKNLLQQISKEDALADFNFSNQLKTILVVGGSLGAKSINEAIKNNLEKIESNNVQLIWQTGKVNAHTYQSIAASKKRIWCKDFIEDMAKAYAAADVVVSRAGAMAIAELCALKKPAVLVPYPFAAENHQTANAKIVEEIQGGILIKDEEANELLVKKVIELVFDEERLKQMSENISQLAKPDAATYIAKSILEFI